MERAKPPVRAHPGRSLALAAALMGPVVASAQVGGGLPGGVGGSMSGMGGAFYPGEMPSGVGPDPDGRFSVKPGIRASVVASDNLDLQPNSTKKFGMLLEVMPYVEASVNSARAVGYAFYGLRGQIRDGGNDSTNEIRHELLARGDFKVTEDLFRVYVRASVFDVNTSPFGVSSFDPGSQSANRSPYKDFEVSPYLSGRFDGDGIWLARYRLRYIDPGSTSQSNTLQSMSGNVRSDLDRRRIGWSVSADVYAVDYERGLSYNGADIGLLGWYPVNPTLRLGVGAAYSQNEILFNAQGENSGWGPSAAIEWTPDARSFVRALWADRYYGDTGTVQAVHRAANWTFGLDYFSGVNDGNRSGLDGASGTGLFDVPTAGGNPGAQGTSGQNSAYQGSTSTGSGIANSPIVYVDALQASVGWLGRRNTVLATLFVNNRRTAVAFADGPVEDLDQRGGSLGFTHRLDARNALNLTARQIVSDSPLVASRATLSSLWATWDRRLTPRATALLGGRVQSQRGDGITVVYNEAALFASIDYRF